MAQRMECNCQYGFHCSSYEKTEYIKVCYDLIGFLNFFYFNCLIIVETKKLKDTFMRALKKSMFMLWHMF